MNRPFLCMRRSMLFLLVLAAAPVGAQTTAENPWKHGTTLSLSGGVASASLDTAPAVAMTAGWEITPWIGLEGTGSWFPGLDGANGFSAVLSVQSNLMPSHAASPFIEGGFGLYLASFDGSTTEIPEFYRSRIDESQLIKSNTFTDPAFLVGGGVNVFTSRHFTVRPTIEALIVTNNSQTYTVPIFTVRVAYHFEDHPITPRR